MAVFPTSCEHTIKTSNNCYACPNFPRYGQVDIETTSAGGETIWKGSLEALITHTITIQTILTN